MSITGVPNWSAAKIDEVRIGDAALTPSQFLFVPNVPLPGDANQNGRIDADDFAAIDRGGARHLTGWSNGDFNDDGTVNAADYTIIYNSFVTQNGYAPSFMPSFAVPEPSLAMLALPALAVLARRRRD